MRDRGRTFTVNLPLAPIEAGTVVPRSAWPLHVTLLPNTEVDDGFDTLVAVVLRFAAEHDPIATTPIGDALFGPAEDVPVDLLESSALLPLHRALLEALPTAFGIRPLHPETLGDGYRPHVTRVGDARAGERVALASLLLAELEPADLPPGSAAVVASASLGASVDPAPVDGSRAAELWSVLESAGVRSCIVGGWGVDALVGRPTRDHHDLDLLVDVATAPSLPGALAAAGLRTSYLWSEHRWIDVDGRRRPTAFVARAADGAEVDVHLVELRDGRPVPLSTSSVDLPAGALDETGSIAGRSVRCATAAAQLVMHTGYDVPERQRADLEHLRRLAASGSTR